MKKGFLLRDKPPMQENNNDSMAVQEAFGPLHDARIDGLMYRWDLVTRRFTSSDPWGNLVESMPSDQLDMINNVKKEAMDDVKRGRNPYQGILNLPFKTCSVPMNALDSYYGKNFKKYEMKMSESYFSWNDENPKSHLLRWTAIFLCPISGEIFVTGSWPMNEPLSTVDSPAVPKIHLSRLEECKLIPDKSTLQENETSSSTNQCGQQCRWMKTIKDAKHGAAAWAYDCFQYRNICLAENLESEGSKDKPIIRVNITGPIGNEIPYLEKQGIFTVPEFVPLSIRDRIEQRQEEIRIGLSKRSDGTIDIELNKEFAWHSLKNHLEGII
jgi:hypothetical protein